MLRAVTCASRRGLARGLAAFAGGAACSLLAREERGAQCLSVLSAAPKGAPKDAPVTKGAGTDALASRYVLHEVLGRGRFGVVHRGTLKATGEQVAIKILPKSSSAAAAPLLDEAELMRALFWHPHVVNLLDSFETAESLVLVMDLCSGGELFDRVVAMGSYTEADASEVMRYVMSAIAHCHSRGVAHRDLKPENIMLASQDTAVDVRICDFGLAQHIEPGKPLRGKVGTVGYAAPEMLRGDPPTYSPRVDEYAVGVILFILLGGYHPFDPDCAADDETITRRVKRGQWGFHDDSWKSISESAKGLLRKLLAADPKDRISAADALEHPWLRGDAASDKPLLKSAARLAEYNEARGAWREATRAAINREGLSTADRRSALAAAFRLIDANGDGQICRKELTVFLNRVEARASPAEIDKMLSQGDIDGDGLISEAEFIAMNL